MAVARRTGGLFGVQKAAAFSASTPMRHSISLSPNSRFGFSRTTETIFRVGDADAVAGALLHLGQTLPIDIREAENVGRLAAGKAEPGNVELVVRTPSNPGGETRDLRRVRRAGEGGLERDRFGLHFDIPDPPLVLDLVAYLLNQLVEIRAAGTQIEALVSARSRADWSR